MAQKRTPTDPLPTTHAALREEIRYWQDRFDARSPGSGGDPEVRQRLEALYALERASAAALPRKSRLRRLFGGLLQGIRWLGGKLSALRGRREKAAP
jgi:hypothetical protein